MSCLFCSVGGARGGYLNTLVSSEDWKSMSRRRSSLQEIRTLRGSLLSQITWLTAVVRAG
jgi:hypothetical protein